jgi:hypothetical protein
VPGGIEPRAVTLEYCCKLVDEWAIIDEAAISNAMLGLLWHHGKLVEGMCMDADVIYAMPLSCLSLTVFASLGSA